MKAMFFHKNCMISTKLDLIKDFLKNLFDPVSVANAFLWEIIFEILKRYHKLITDIVYWKFLDRLGILVTFPLRLFFSLKSHRILLKAPHKFFIKVFFLEVVDRTFTMKGFVPMSSADFFVGFFESLNKSESDELIQKYITLAKYQARSYGCSIEDVVKLRYYVRGLIGENQFWLSLVREARK